MNSLLPILISVSVSVVVCFATNFLLRKNAQNLGLVQIPNDRSSHTVNTPTGGGLGIVLGLIFALLTLSFFPEGPEVSSLWPAVGLATLLAFVGFIDDWRPLSAKLRLFVQFATISTLVYAYGLDGLVPDDSDILVLGFLLSCTIIGGVWWLNLFNFLDGLDGFAATQAAFMLCAAGFLIGLNVDVWTLSFTSLLVCLLAAILAFLTVNWPPAKIFMGDVGSMFLGAMLFAIALSSIQENLLHITQWIILGSIFIADATITLLRRLLRRENVAKAHKSHAYQILAQKLNHHRPVVFRLIILNTVIILPLAWLAGTYPNISWFVVVLLAAILAILMVNIGAGRSETDITQTR